MKNSSTVIKVLRSPQHHLSDSEISYISQCRPQVFQKHNEAERFPSWLYQNPTCVVARQPRFLLPQRHRLGVHVGFSSWEWETSALQRETPSAFTADVWDRRNVCFRCCVALFYFAVGVKKKKEKEKRTDTEHPRSTGGNWLREKPAFGANLIVS